jgi:hypothetical protein
MSLTQEYEFWKDWLSSEFNQWGLALLATITFCCAVGNPIGLIGFFIATWVMVYSRKN